MYKSFDEALNHLNNKRVHVYLPEQIRGGGLLKYCDMLYQGYGHDPRKSTEESVLKLENYMLVRFFVTFLDGESVKKAIQSYLACHYTDRNLETIGYLETIRKVIARPSCSEGELAILH